MIPGLDVSHWEAKIKWDDVLRAGYLWCYAKATESLTYVDPLYSKHWADMKAAGVARGAYHFARPQYDAAQQADHFAQTVGLLAPDDLAPCLDLETNGDKPAAHVIAWTRNFLARAEKLFDRPLMIYVGHSFLMDFLGDPELPDLASRPIWIPRYGLKTPRPSKTWPRWTIWQHSEDFEVPGVGKCDANWLDGELSLLRTA